MKNYKTLIFAVLIIFLLSWVYALYMDNNSIPITPTVKKSIISDNNIENNTASNVGIVLENEVLTNSYQTNNTNPSTSLIKKPKVPESFNTKFEYMEFYKIYLKNARIPWLLLSRGWIALLGILSFLINFIVFSFIVFFWRLF